MLTESEKVFIKYIDKIKSINSYTEFLKWQLNNEQKTKQPYIGE
jgi:hypothetical protein